MWAYVQTIRTRGEPGIVPSPARNRLGAGVAQQLAGGPTGAIRIRASNVGAEAGYDPRTRATQRNGPRRR